MERRFTPHVQAQLEQLAAATEEYSPETLANDLLSGCLSGQHEVRQTLHRRYDDIKNARDKHRRKSINV